MGKTLRRAFPLYRGEAEDGEYLRWLYNTSFVHRRAIREGRCTPKYHWQTKDERTRRRKLNRSMALSFGSGQSPIRQEATSRTGGLTHEARMVCQRGLTLGQLRNTPCGYCLMDGSCAN